MALDAKLPNVAQVGAMTRFQWFCVKRLLGRPRRFSPKFVQEQIAILNRQRALVKELQSGQQPVVDVPLPASIPAALCVGDRVLGKVDSGSAVRCWYIDSLLSSPSFHFLARAPGYKGLLAPGTIFAVAPDARTYRGVELAP